MKCNYSNNGDMDLFMKIPDKNVLVYFKLQY
jgi:hypothetical protein